MFTCIYCGAKIELEVGICVNDNGDFVCSLSCKDRYEEDQEFIRGEQEYDYEAGIL